MNIQKIEEYNRREKYHEPINIIKIYTIFTQQ